jgi:hypothetical protein
VKSDKKLPGYAELRALIRASLRSQRIGLATFFNSSKIYRLRTSPSVFREPRPTNVALPSFGPAGTQVSQPRKTGSVN